jgi:hypothetical protein
MGILDEAIREHLELKRKHGAREADLKNLEQEAFGPPLRPGELPQSPQADTAAALAAQQPAESAPELESAPEAPAPPEAAAAPAGLDETQEHAMPDFAEEDLAEEDHLAGEDDLTDEGEQMASEPSEPPPLHEEPAEHLSAGHFDDYEPPEPPTPPPDGTAERVQAVTPPPEPLPEPEEEPEALTQDMGDEPPPEPPDRIGESLAVITEGESPLADFYDFDDEGDLADELEADLGAEEDQPEKPAAPPPEGTGEIEPEPIEAEPEPQAPEPEPIEPESEEAPLEEEPAVAEEPGPALYDAADEGEDVLEETPEFLQDAPENEDLWFEQRPPKDFDFDD